MSGTTRTADRGGLWVAVAIVAGLLGLAAWFTMGGGVTQGEAHGAAPAISKPEAPETEAPGFQAPEPAAPTPLTPAPGETPAVKPGELTSAVTTTSASGPHVVAKGRVTWPGGALPAECDVKLHDAEGFDVDLAYTAEDGSFELSSDDALEPGWSFGTEPIEVTHKGEKAWLAPAVVADLPLHAPGDPPVERELVLGFAPVLMGVVTDADSHLPVPGAEVHVGSTASAYAFDELYTETGPDGRYLLELEELPLSGLIAWCLADDYQAELAGPIDLEPAGSPQDAVTQDFALRQPVVVRGRVIDGLSREPLDGATISVGSRFALLAGSTDFELTDPDGTFELDVTELPLQGGWMVFSFPELAAVGMPLERGAEFVEATLGAPFTVSGLVTDGLGKAVPNARLEFAYDGDTPSLDQQMFDQADCDADGRYEVMLEVVPDRDAIVRVDVVGHVPYRERLTEVGQLGANNRWELNVRLRAD
jgi:hypothetical protein